MHPSGTPSASGFPVRQALLAAAALATLLAAPAQAVTVLDTFGPGGTTPGQGWQLFKTASNNFQSLAVTFTLTDTLRIDSIASSIDGAGSYSLKVVADLANMPIGSVLHSTSLNNPALNSSVAGLNWVLSPGKYWLTGEAAVGSAALWRGGGSSVNTVWSFLAPNLPGWQPIFDGDTPAVRINASVVPEPGSWLLALGGMAFVGWRVGRRHG